METHIIWQDPDNDEAPPFLHLPTHCCKWKSPTASLLYVRTTLRLPHASASRQNSAKTRKSHLNPWYYANHAYFRQKRWQTKGRKWYCLQWAAYISPSVFQTCTNQAKASEINKEPPRRKAAPMEGHTVRTVTTYRPCIYTPQVWIQGLKCDPGETEALSAKVIIIISTPHGDVRMKWGMLHRQFCNRTKSKNKKSLTEGTVSYSHGRRAAPASVRRWWSAPWTSCPVVS